MSEIPQAFKDAIETEWRHDDKLNAEILTARFRATSWFTCSNKEAEMFKDVIEEHVASGLYKFVSRIVGETEETVKLRKLVRNIMACMRNKDCDTCPYREEPCDFDYDMRELGIEVIS